MAATKLANRGDGVMLANPVTGATLLVPKGGEVEADHWPGLGDNPDWKPATATRKSKKTPGGTAGGGSK